MKPVLVNLLPLAGIALLWRTALWLSPSIGMTVVGMLLYAGIAIFYVQQPVLRTTLKWASLILAGACLNFAAIIGNGGQMPYPHVMSSAWWVWLGDWMGGVVSPGDILIFLAVPGIITTLLISHKYQPAEVEA